MNSFSLAEIAEIIMGQSPPSSEYNSQGKGLPFFQGKTEFGDLHPTVKMYCTEPKKIAEVNDILISVRAPVGPTNINITKSCIGRGLAAIRCSKKVDLYYLLYFLRFHESKLAEMGQGSTFEAINKDDLEDINIPLPPLEEQKRIAKIAGKCDRLRRTRRYTQQLSDTYLQSVFLEMFGDPIINPYGWEIVSLDECAEKIQIGPFGTQLHEEDYIKNGIPLINPTHIKDGKISPNPSFSISFNKYNQLSQYHLEVNDIILGRRGEMGRCAIISKIEDGWLCGTGSLFVRPKYSLLNSTYLFSLLSSDSIKKQLEIDSQGVTMANLNKTIVGQISVPVPPIALQEKFAQIVQRFERLRAQQRESDRQAEHLFQTVLHRAFSGEL